MKKIILVSIVLFFEMSFAGVTVVNTGGASQVFGSGGFGQNEDSKIFENTMKKYSSDKLLAIELGRMNGKIKFQTAVPVEGEWKVQTWQGNEEKLQEVPKLAKALDLSRSNRSWQQLEKK